jgi:hypothetical protein
MKNKPGFSESLNRRVAYPLLIKKMGTAEDGLTSVTARRAVLSTKPSHLLGYVTVMLERLASVTGCVDGIKNYR